MNKKQRLAVVFLVIAIVILFTSVIIEISVANAEKANEEFRNEVVSETVGTVNLEILPQEGRFPNGEG